MAVGPGRACVVVVDVLSFTTSVSVAVEAGTYVLPYPWRDGEATQFAARRGAGGRAASGVPAAAVVAVSGGVAARAGRGSARRMVRPSARP